MAVSLRSLTEIELSRFQAKINKTDTCWLWTASVSIKGYGFFRLSRVTIYAHRIAYWLAYGIDPGSLLVCHTCDTPACVNPDHLFLGTHKDNQDDKVKKNRQSHAFKLSVEVRSTLRNLFILHPIRLPGGLRHILADKYGVHADTITYYRPRGHL